MADKAFYPTYVLSSGDTGELGCRPSRPTPHRAPLIGMARSSHRPPTLLPQSTYHAPHCSPPPALLDWSHQRTRKTYLPVGVVYRAGTCSCPFWEKLKLSPLLFSPHIAFKWKTVRTDSQGLTVLVSPTAQRSSNSTSEKSHWPQFVIRRVITPRTNWIQRQSVENLSISAGRKDYGVRQKAFFFLSFF